MELRQLRYFVAVAEERHFGRAAERLHIAQPGLSQQIMALEKSIGAKLLDREVRPVALTEAGEALLPRARKLITAADEALEAARATAPSPTGVLKLGVPLVGHFPVVSELFSLVRRRSPDVEVRAVPGLSLNSYDLLSRGGLDAAIVHVPSDWPKTPSYLRLGAHEMTVMLPTAHRLASLERLPRAELLKERFLDWPSTVNPQLLDHVRREVFGVTPHPRGVEVEHAMDGASRALLVAQGKGIAIDAVSLSPDGLPKREGVVNKRVEDPPPLLEHGLIWFEEDLSLLASSLVETSKDLVANALASGAPSRNAAV